MERREVEKMASVEDAMWWYRALRANLSALLPGPEQGAGLRLLDAGCGTGGWLKALAAERPDIDSTGLEYDPLGAELAARRSGRPVAVGSIASLPFAHSCFDIVTSSDVLCHAGVDEAASLDEMRRCLRPGGHLLMNLPAYEWMMSEHDRSVANARRYSEAGLVALLKTHGFSDIRATFWNSVLFPLMVLKRKLAPSGGTSDVTNYPKPLEAIFSALTGLETAAIRKGAQLPFGGSILVKAVRA